MAGAKVVRPKAVRRTFRVQMRPLDFGHREIATEFARQYKLRPVAERAGSVTRRLAADGCCDRAAWTWEHGRTVVADHTGPSARTRAKASSHIGRTT
jgi:hypothetical protein